MRLAANAFGLILLSSTALAQTITPRTVPGGAIINNNAGVLANGQNGPGGGQAGPGGGSLACPGATGVVAPIDTLAIVSPR